MNLKYLIVVSVCVAGAILFAGYRYNKAMSPAYATQYHQESNGGPVRNLRFTLFEAGIRPNEIQIKSGLVQILLEDKSNVAQGLIVRRLVGAEKVGVGTVQKANQQMRGRTLFRLAPGEYELFDPSQPASKAVVTVEP